MKICPRCHGNCSIICCALCRDHREVSNRLYKAYKDKIKDNRCLSIEETIELRDSFYKENMDEYDE